MRKLISTILAAAMLLAVFPAFAAGETTVRLKNTSARGPVYIAAYDTNNRLVSVKEAQAQMDGRDALISVPAGMPANGQTMGVYIPQTNVFVIPETEQDPGPQPNHQPDQSPEPTQAPEATLNPAYESEASAILAFMVVKDVTSGLGEDDLPVTVVSGYYQGREISFQAEEGATVDTVPDAYSELDGMDIAGLQEGDVIYFRVSMSGTMRGVDLVFRPMDTDIVAEPEYNFTSLYTVDGLTTGRWAPLNFGGKPANKNQYAFGVVKDRSRNILVLTDQAGKAQDMLYLGLTDDTVVYIYDKSARNKLSVGGVGDIFPSVIPAAAKDSDGNITAWDAEDDHHYALARMYNGIVSDVIVYTNY